MKRLAAVLLAGLLILSLFSGCAKQSGGTYILDRVTTEGKRIRPSELNLNIRFTLENDGTGNGSFNGTYRNFTWTENSDSVTITGNGGTLNFTKDGKELLLHDSGTILCFVPEETDD